jgi:DUF2075 family protein
MRLYAGSSEDFISDSVHNRIADKLRTAYFNTYRQEATPGEVNSWRNSLRALSQVFEYGGFKGNGVALEYELPLTSRRLDCILTGRGALLNDEAAIIELKQWERCDEADAERVVTFVGRNNRDVLHPSAQVSQYRQYLADYQPAFYEEENPIGLRGCAYLHNYLPQPGDALLAEKYRQYIQECPVFTADDVPKLIDFLREKLVSGDEQYALRRILEGRFRPCKKLLEHVGRLLDGKDEYVLLDEQLVAFERVMAVARDVKNQRQKTVIVIRGGPGTGKSVIALNLLARLSGKDLHTNYVTGSAAFTQTLRKIVGTRAREFVKHFSSYMVAEPECVDVMICDEAHRMWLRSRSRQYRATGKFQIEELINASRAAIFFLDDRQSVRPDEIGTAQYVIDFATEANCRIFDYKLEAQFRCAGSAAFVSWVENTLDIERTANVLWNSNEQFEFRIVDSPTELDKLVREKLALGHSARLMAGFCWKWSNPNADGTLVDDVHVGGFKRPWNAKSKGGHLARGIPREQLWAYDPRGVDQVGCIYTAQGFEFDYSGVIFGPDLVYRPGRGWVGQREQSFDRPLRNQHADFLNLVKNTYRVLLSRAMKGCYVYFVDKQTEDFFRSRVEAARTQRKSVSES